MKDLPESVAEIAEVIGRDRALYLIGQLPSCGKRSWRVSLYIPKRSRLTPDHPLVAMVGWQDAVKLTQMFGGLIMQPSNCRFIHRNWRNRSIYRMFNEGMTKRDIAKLFDISERQVRNIIAELTPQAKGG